MNQPQEVNEENIKNINLHLKTVEDFEEVGEDNFGSKINKIDWKEILKKAGIIIFIIFILVMILR